MKTSAALGRHSRSTIGTIRRVAMAIGFAAVIGGVGAGPALAGGDNGRHQAPRQAERHDIHRHQAPARYYAPAPTYYAPPNYAYAPAPVYYDQPAPSEGWTFIFP